LTLFGSVGGQLEPRRDTGSRPRGWIGRYSSSIYFFSFHCRFGGWLFSTINSFLPGHFSRLEKRVPISSSTLSSFADHDSALFLFNPLRSEGRGSHFSPFFSLHYPRSRTDHFALHPTFLSLPFFPHFSIPCPLCLEYTPPRPKKPPAPVVIFAF